MWLRVLSSWFRWVRGSVRIQEAVGLLRDFSFKRLTGSLMEMIVGELFELSLSVSHVDS